MIKTILSKIKQLNQQGESKYIYIDECYLDNGRYWQRPDTDCIKELQSYEKYFERLT